MLLLKKKTTFVASEKYLPGGWRLPKKDHSSIFCEKALGQGGRFRAEERKHNKEVDIPTSADEEKAAPPSSSRKIREREDAIRMPKISGSRKNGPELCLDRKSQCRKRRRSAAPG